MLKSSAPMALVILDTNRGTIKHFSIRKNKSPGYCIYITSRCVHFSRKFFNIKPRAVPPNTPNTVHIVSAFVAKNCFHLDEGEALVVPFDVDITNLFLKVMRLLYFNSYAIHVIHKTPIKQSLACKSWMIQIMTLERERVFLLLMNSPWANLNWVNL